MLVHHAVQCARALGAAQTVGFARIGKLHFAIGREQVAVLIRLRLHELLLGTAVQPVQLVVAATPLHVRLEHSELLVEHGQNETERLVPGDQTLFGAHLRPEHIGQVLQEGVAQQLERRQVHPPSVVVARQAFQHLM